MLHENNRAVDVGLRATVTVLRHLTGWLIEEEGAYSVRFQKI